MHNNFNNALAYLFLIELGEEENKADIPHFSELEYRKIPGVRFVPLPLR